MLVVTAMYPKPGRPEFGAFVRNQFEALEQAGLDMNLLVLDGPNRKLVYPKGIFQLRSRLAADSYDLVHAHYSFVGAVARTQWKVPIVLTYHGSDLLGHVVDFDGRKTRFSQAAAAGGRMLANLVDAVIVQSEEMARLLRRHDVNVIPHEIDFETFQPTGRERARELLGLDPHRPYVLFACRPDWRRKNFPVAQAAVEQVRSSFPDVELIVVYREPQPRLALYMSACDVLSFPSLQEGSPNIIKQAMACNLPIVATDVGDIRELIETTEGCHVAAPSPQAFAAPIEQELSLRRRTNGRSAMRRFAPEIVTARVAEVYETVLRGRRTRRVKAPS